jgi:hypothetical protein
VIVPGVRLNPGSMIRSRVWMYRTGTTAPAVAATGTPVSRPARPAYSPVPASHC